MGIVHSWFESGWNWIGIGLVFAGLGLMRFDGIVQYVAGVCIVCGLLCFLLSSDREDYQKL